MERAAPPAPTRPEERIVLLDALRGFALLGVHELAAGRADGN